MRHRLIFTIASLCFAACGGGTNNTTTPDAAVKDVGFNKPTKPLMANMEASSNNWTEIGPADLSCLNTPSADQATTVAVTLNTIVKDFQSGSPVANAMVTAFKDIDTANPFSMATSSSSAYATFTIPAGTKRFGFKMTGDFMTTFLLNQTVNPSDAVQPVGSDTDKTKSMTIQSVSNATAATLPALIGETRNPGTGVLAGAFRDCAHHEISNFVATVSSTKGMATPLEGAEAYYFSSSVGLPVHHNQQESASGDALFMLIQIPAAPTAYVQLWGYPTMADLMNDKLTLVAELQVPVLADTVITGSYEPLRQ